MINLIYESYLLINTRPASDIKLACEEAKCAIVIEDGVIVEIVKEK